MILDTGEAKLYCRIDYDEDDDLIDDLIDFAENYLRSAVDDFDNKLENNRFKNHVKLAMMRIVKNEYDNRDTMETRIGERVSFYMQSTIQQLKNSYGDVK